MIIYAVIESYGSEGSGHWEAPLRHFTEEHDAAVFKTAIELHQLELAEAAAMGWNELRRAEHEFMIEWVLERPIDAESDYFIRTYEVY